MHFGRFRSLVGAGILLLGGTLFMHAESDLNSTNTDRLSYFWSAMDDPGTPVTVLSFGDSMSESGRSIQLELFDRLRTQHGTGGISFSTVWNAALWQFGGGAYLSEPNTNWWTRHACLPMGSFVYWWNERDTQGNSVLSDSVGVFWLARPEGGEFTLSVSSNGGAWSAPLLTLQGYSDQPVGCYTNLPLIRDKYRLRVDGISGTNLILGPRYLDAAAGGVDVAFMAKGGANLDQIFSLSTNVLYPILASVDPQLVVLHMKEVGDIGATALSNRLHDLELLWQHCVPDGDIVYIGTPYEQMDLHTNRTEAQNILVREAAVRDGRCYVDCMTPMVSYQWMTNHNYLDDTVHVSKTGNQFLADVLWDELGFYALRLDRTLGINPSPQGVVLDWATRQGVTFDLQRTTNLTTWEAVHSVRGDGSRHFWTNPPSKPTALYRVRASGD